MNNYITLDGYKYKTLFGKWQPIINKDATVREVLTGKLDVTYGPMATSEWQGEIEANEVPEVGYGSRVNLMASLAKLSSVSFTDHYGSTYMVHCLGPFKAISMTPMWDGSSNVHHVAVRIIAEA